MPDFPNLNPLNIHIPHPHIDLPDFHFPTHRTNWRYVTSGGLMVDVAVVEVAGATGGTGT